MASRPPLGIALGDELGAPSPPPISKGHLILGIIADALSGAAGQPGQFAARMGEDRRQQREDAQWSRRRQGLLQDWQAQEDYKRTHPDLSPMVRDADAWQQMTPDQRTNYQAAKVAGAGDPDVFVTLPNGQVYAGPKSGLSQALMGGGQPPQRPVGRLTPIDEGGPTPGGSGGFPY